MCFDTLDPMEHLFWFIPTVLIDNNFIIAKHLNIINHSLNRLYLPSLTNVNCAESRQFEQNLLRCSHCHFTTKIDNDDDIATQFGPQKSFIAIGEKYL